LAEGETAHPANYYGCSHAEEDQGKTQNHNRKVVLLKFYSTSCVLCSGTPEKNKGKMLCHEEVPGTNKHKETKKEQ
jgi:hypothetical protein